MMMKSTSPGKQGLDEHRPSEAREEGAETNGSTNGKKWITSSRPRRRLWRSLAPRKPQNRNPRSRLRMPTCTSNTRTESTPGNTGWCRKTPSWRRCPNRERAANSRCSRRTWWAVRPTNWTILCVCLWRRSGSLTGRSMLRTVYSTCV